MNRLKAICGVPALALTVFAALGCSEPQSHPLGPGDPPTSLQPGAAPVAAGALVSLELEGDEPAPGEEARLLLRNGGAEQVGYNLCFHDLEQRVGSAWISLALSRICTTEIRYLSPDAAADFGVVIPAALTSGDYRYRVAVWLDETRTLVDVASAPFTVE